MKRFLLSLMVCIGFSVTAHAADSEFYFNLFQDSGIDFEQDGRICQEIAAYEVRGEFGMDYDVLTDISYSYGKLTVGELDIVVKDRKTQKVVMVSEVKCWKNPKGGMRKAMQQRARFENALSTRADHLIFEEISRSILNVLSFSGPYEYRTISQIGGAEFGFDQELPLTLRELTQLRSRLLKCQAFGPCKRPGRSIK